MSLINKSKFHLKEEIFSWTYRKPAKRIFMHSLENEKMIRVSMNKFYRIPNTNINNFSGDNITHENVRNMKIHYQTEE